MFPRDNLDAQNQRWVRSIQDVIDRAESRQPQLDQALPLLNKQSASVLDDVTSNINAYYTSTLAQYPAFQRTASMTQVLGGPSKTVSISAPAAADSSVAENWVSLFAYAIPLPSSQTAMAVRLNGAQFKLSGPSAYYLRVRWRVNTQVEGINTSRWMSRHEFNLTVYNMDTTNPPLVNVGNRYAYRTGSAVSSVTVELQASIENIANRNNAVAAQDITLIAEDNNGNETYLDVMITV